MKTISFRAGELLGQLPCPGFFESDARAVDTIYYKVLVVASPGPKFRLDDGRNGFSFSEASKFFTRFLTLRFHPSIEKYGLSFWFLSKILKQFRFGSKRSSHGKEHTLDFFNVHFAKPFHFADDSFFKTYSIRREYREMPKTGRRRRLRIISWRKILTTRKIFIAP